MFAPVALALTVPRFTALPLFTRRWMLKPVSFAALSVHFRVAVVPETVAVRFDGAAGAVGFVGPLLLVG
jgi:hypothetical protein